MKNWKNGIKETLTFDVSSRQQQLPVMTVSLLGLFYLIGILLFDSYYFRLSRDLYRMDTYIVTYPKDFDEWAIDQNRWKQSGGLSLKSGQDQIIMMLLVLHSLPMFIHFFDAADILPYPLMSYLIP